MGSESQQEQTSSQTNWPVLVISVNKEHNTCCVRIKQGVQRGLHMDSLCLVKARAHKAESKFNIPNVTLEKFGAQKIDDVPAKTL